MANRQIAVAKLKLKDFKLVLVVEGYSDLHFFAELLEQIGIAGVFIEQLNGKSDILAQLEAFLTDEVLAEKSAIGVIVDADANLKNAAQSLSGALKKITGVELQQAEWKLLGNARPGSIGFFVIGDQQGQGELETVVWNAWANDPANAARKQCIEQFLACMDGAGLTSKSIDKGRISAYLAIANDEDPRLGPGAQARCFDLDRPEFGELKTFLRGLLKQP